MRVYQAAWDISGELIVWGEKASTFNELVPSDVSFDENNESLFHPFACSEQQIDEDIALLEFAPDEFKTIEISLPSDHYGPLPSPRLAVSHELERDTEPSMRQWRVRAAIFKPYPAACFLTSIPSQSPVGIRFDDSVSYWTEVTKFLLEILCHGHFIPMTKQEMIKVFRFVANSILHRR